MSNLVKHAFFDKEDGMKPYSKGDSYSGDEKRVAFLIEKGFLEEKSKQPPKKKKADKK